MGLFYPRAHGVSHLLILEFSHRFEGLNFNSYSPKVVALIGHVDFTICMKMFCISLWTVLCFIKIVYM